MKMLVSHQRTVSHSCSLCCLLLDHYFNVYPPYLECLLEPWCLPACQCLLNALPLCSYLIYVAQVAVERPSQLPEHHSCQHLAHRLAIGLKCYDAVDIGAPRQHYLMLEHLLYHALALSYTPLPLQCITPTFKRPGKIIVLQTPQYLSKSSINLLLCLMLRQICVPAVESTCNTTVCHAMHYRGHEQPLSLVLAYNKRPLLENNDT
mmetsp:Transcript_58131/g.85193  ORF Transcript_58131/g.85193 Transcript_58131/m.85193 type:complete len:206 (+) Transcript_58131:988-1605(+)